MEVAASVGTDLALSGLPVVVKKLASYFGGDVTPAEMEHLNVFVRYEIEVLIREAKSDDLLKSAPLLEKLQAAALELEDLLDLYEYNQLEKQVSSSSSSSSSNTMKKFISKSKEKLGPFLPKSSLRIGVEKLLKFVEQVEKLHPFIMSRKGTTHPPANTVTPKTSTPSSPFYGRGDQCDTIVKLLLDESHADLNFSTKNVPIIAIRGLGGTGKTTTAQHVYNENKIVNYFDLRMWVHVTRDFDERRLIKEIIESAEKNTCPQISSLDVLQTKLKDSVSEKKFLLVLDDVWEESTERFDILLSPLNQVRVKGSKILVTTRTKKVAQDLHAKPILLLDELKDEDCWSILKHHAIDDNNETIESLEELRYVGNQIISKVKHSPLSLKVVGSSLRNKKSANEWRKILQQKDISKDTMDLLLFSYQFLPLHLQRCFAYCSLFPKGYKFCFDFEAWRPNLIYLWIAQGFLENTNELTLEETGQNYIEELLSYSFFEKKYDHSYGSFVIHDLLHELAENVSKNKCHRIEHYDSLHVPTTCIHLSICITENVVSMDHPTILAICDIFNSRNLRSLIIWRSGSKNIFESSKDIFHNFTNLRALYVGGEQMEVLSDPLIDKLKLLRYLHVGHDSKLPTSLTKLYQLQFFILTTDSLVDESGKYLVANTLPKCFSNLFNLRILKFYHFFEELDYLYYNSEMINIGELKSLQSLNTIYCDDFNGLISLKNLPIVDSLSLLNLENVKCKEEAKVAMLDKKKKLNKLTYEWSSASNSIDTCINVLEGLVPHRNLEELTIKGYQAVRFPNWMVKENWLPSLKNLRLESCRSLKIVPFLPPRLQKLYVCDCDELMQLPPLNDTLLTLWLSKCPKLMPSSMFKKSLGFSDLPFLPNLVELYLRGVPNLPALADLSFLTSIKELELSELPNLQALANLSPTVTHLRIKDYPKLTSLGYFVEGDIANRLPQVEQIDTDELLLVLELVLQQAFSSIKKLTVSDFTVAALPNLEMLSSLESLKISDCPDVESLPKLPVSLESLFVCRCPKLKEMHEEGGPLGLTGLSLRDCAVLLNLEVLSSLRHLFLDDLDIESLPKLPVSLQLLQVHNCPKLKEMHQEGGPLHIDLKALSNLEQLSSLHAMEIINCPAIELLPVLPVSLQSFWIYECPKLKENYGEGGPLRNTISHMADRCQLMIVLS